MFSTIKSIIKTLSVFSLFATLVVAGISSVNASAVVNCGTFNVADGQTCPRTAGTTTGGNDLTPPLCGSGSPGYKCALFQDPASATTLLGSREGILKFILNIASFFIYVASAVAVLFIVWGGYNYINAADPKGNESGKKILINALIGLAICILSITIVTFVSSTLDSNLLTSITK